MSLQKETRQKETVAVGTRGQCELCNDQCSTREVGRLLIQAGLRPTRQRLALARILFRNEDRHITADCLHDDARKESVRVSLATVYNTLQQFTKAGLLRRLAIDGQKTWYDTNTSEHHHFFREDDNCVLDIAAGEIALTQLPAVPPGMEIARVEVVVRLRKRC
jgi:Fur family iron response transcriptional regulator